jgi:hypothetical protein
LIALRQATLRHCHVEFARGGKALLSRRFRAMLGKTSIAAKHIAQWLSR